MSVQNDSAVAQSNVSPIYKLARNDNIAIQKRTALKCGSLSSFKRFDMRLDYDDIHRFKLIFKRVGEIVVGDEHVDIFGVRKRVGLDFADL